MLKHVRNLGLRIGEFDAPSFDTKEIAASLNILHEYFGSNSSSVRPHPDEDIIRDAIRSIAPKIATLADLLVETLESSHSGIFIPKLKLDTFDVETRKLLLYALTLCMGHPSATDQVDNRIIWDIKARDEFLKASHIPTYSEHANEAELHTDTQYHPEPERYLILYFIRQANCGGGTSILRDFNSIKQNMRQSTEGAWAVEYLENTNLPFQVPTSFTSNQRSDNVEVTIAPIFGTFPSIRYRRDTLKRGLQARTEFDTSETRHAISLLEKELQNTELLVKNVCYSDGFFMLNNHEALHGRESFTDRERYAVRIRISNKKC